MTVPGKSSVPGNGLCWFAIQRVPTLVDAFSKEITGVREARDIEYIHRMRVASRRLRAALPLFHTCFEEKQYKRWMKEISGITRALGEARDADVQIAFLQKTLKKIHKDSGKPVKKSAQDLSAVEPAIRFLLIGLQDKRVTLQEHVKTSLTELEKSGTIEELRQVFASGGGEIPVTRKRLGLFGIPLVAAIRIEKKVSALLEFEPWVHHPEAVAEHHAMRIAAKKLRYTMEIYGPVYRNNLKKPLARVKGIQEILGEIHDCDVWIDQITRLMLRERSLLRTVKGTKRPDTTTLASLRVLLLERERERKRLYRQFVRYWQTIVRDNLWDDLRLSLDFRRKTAYRPPSSYREDSASARVSSLSMTDPASRPHCLHVTDLALMLFDELVELHNLGSHERFLLSCAGQIHDIGWKFGARAHNRRGAGMVFSDEDLPFDLQERAILAFIIFSHRGKVRLSGNPFLNLITPENRDKAMILAAILRTADGLDTTHSGSVHAVHCGISAGIIACSISGSGDLMAEVQRAENRADLLRQVFKRPLVIS